MPKLTSEREEIGHFYFIMEERRIAVLLVIMVSLIFKKIELATDIDKQIDDSEKERISKSSSHVVSFSG
jgi:hypothetical protein